MEGGSALPDLVRPAIAHSAEIQMDDDDDNGIDYTKDPLFQALNKLATGATVDSLTPAERQAWNHLPH